MNDRHYVSLYFDSAEEKQAFRVRAAREGVSMAELALRAVRTLFLAEPSYDEDARPLNGTRSPAIVDLTPGALEAFPPPRHVPVIDAGAESSAAQRVRVRDAYRRGLLTAAEAERLGVAIDEPALEPAS